MHARSISERRTTWEISFVSLDAASPAMRSPCPRPASVDAHWSLPPQAQPVGQLRHAAGQHQSAFSAFPRDYRKLPTVSFVSPNMCHDMHDCSIRTGDRWMKKHFRRYARWAPRHNSLLIVTFDENAGGTVKPIPTIIVGAGTARASTASGSTTTRCFAPSRMCTACRRLATRRPVAT